MVTGRRTAVRVCERRNVRDRHQASGGQRRVPVCLPYGFPWRPVPGAPERMWFWPVRSGIVRGSDRRVRMPMPTWTCRYFAWDQNGCLCFSPRLYWPQKIFVRKYFTNMMWTVGITSRITKAHHTKMFYVIDSFSLHVVTQECVHK